MVLQTDAFFKKEGLKKPALNVGRPPKKPKLAAAAAAGANAAQQVQQARMEFQQRCKTLLSGTLSITGSNAPPGPHYKHSSPLTPLRVKPAVLHRHAAALIFA